LVDNLIGRQKPLVAAGLAATRASM